MTGAGNFLFGLELDARHFHGSSHRSQFVLRFDEGFDVGRCRSGIRTAFEEIPMLRASVERRWGDIAGPRVYRIHNQPPRSIPFFVHDETNIGKQRLPLREQTTLYAPHLNTKPVAPKAGKIIRFDLYRGRRACDLVITWLHFLLDGQGILNLVALLSRLDGEDARSCSTDNNLSGERLFEVPSLPERLLIAKEWSGRMKALSDPPPGSPAGPVRTVPQDLGYNVIQPDGAVSENLRDSARKEAGFLTPMVFYLAISIRAHHQLFLERGDVPESYLVPVPVNFRDDESDFPVFRTHVSFFWFRVSPEDVEPRPELVRTLKEQRTEQIRHNFPRQMAIAMENNRYVPHWINRKLMRFQTGGELASFFFSYLDTVLPDVSSLFGGKLLDGYHAPGVPPSPGSSLIWGDGDGPLRLTHVYQKSAVDAGERELIQGQIRKEARSP